VNNQKFFKNIFSPLDTISLPNYTGSLGYGDEFVQRLIGNCGKLDVEDCYESIRHLIKSGIAEEGPGKQFLTGGSHGGFLIAHRMSFFFFPTYCFFKSVG
jgi:acylaminoacyl-peptidase